MDETFQLSNKLQQCWLDNWGSKFEQESIAISNNQQNIDRVFQLLVAAYSKPDRYYHNLQHIHQILTIIDRFGDRVQNYISVYLAAWFHDFIYDSQVSGNEGRSAKAAQKLLASIGISNDLIYRVQQIILATQGHQGDPNDSDLCIFLDADLAILGTNSVEYLAYARSIRCEYSWVSDEAYQAGRIRILESFLQRDRLYYTDLLFNELESIARLNIQQEIAKLLMANGEQIKIV